VSASRRLPGYSSIPDDKGHLTGSIRFLAASVAAAIFTIRNRQSFVPLSLTGDASERFKELRRALKVDISRATRPGHVRKPLRPLFPGGCTVIDGLDSLPTVSSRKIFPALD